MFLICNLVSRCKAYQWYHGGSRSIIKMAVFSLHLGLFWDLFYRFSNSKKDVFYFSKLFFALLLSPIFNLDFWRANLKVFLFENRWSLVGHSCPSCVHSPHLFFDLCGHFRWSAVLFEDPDKHLLSIPNIFYEKVKEKALLLLVLELSHSQWHLSSYWRLFQIFADWSNSQKYKFCKNSSSVCGFQRGRKKSIVKTSIRWDFIDLIVVQCFLTLLVSLQLLSCCDR